MARPGMEHVEIITSRILQIRGEKILIDSDLAKLYGVTTKRLNEQVKRNRGRFPTDFAFRLSEEEKSEVVANCDNLASLRYSSAMPQAFTEHGAIMVAMVLSSERAVKMSVFVVRAFVRLRRAVTEHAELKARLDAVERKLASRDSDIATLVSAVRQLLAPSAVPKKRRTGFRADDS